MRFCGSTEFSGGLWAGIELDQAEGKNDGSVAGVQYFTCQNKHGMYTERPAVPPPPPSPGDLQICFTLLPLPFYHLFALYEINYKKM